MFMDAAILGVVNSSVVPAGYSLSFLGTQERQFRDRGVDAVDDAVQQGLVMPCHAANGGGLEQLGVKLEASAQRSIRLVELLYDEIEIELAFLLLRELDALAVQIR